MPVKSKPKPEAPAPVNHPLSFDFPKFGTLGDATAAETLTDHAQDVAAFAEAVETLKEDYASLLADGFNMHVADVLDASDELNKRRGELDEEYARLRRRRFDIARDVFPAFQACYRELQRKLDATIGDAIAESRKRFPNVTTDVLRTHAMASLPVAQARAEAVAVDRQLDEVESLARNESPNISVRECFTWPEANGEDERAIERLISSN